MEKNQKDAVKVAEKINFQRLSAYACKNSDAIRKYETTEDIRLPFQMDIDKITYSNSFSRYFGKTQVYTVDYGDHITRRNTHVQYVCRISRTIARALGLNEDLCEAIALGHDIGHVPFGHAGEAFLSKICKERIGTIFAHNVQSVRQLCLLEKGGEGLNLTYQVIDGILCHNGEILHKEYRPMTGKTKEMVEEEYINCYKSYDNIKKLTPMTLEGCVVRISDIIAYVGKDIEDAISMGILEKDKLPYNIKEMMKNGNSGVVNLLVEDVIENSYNKGYLSMSDKVYSSLQCLLKFNIENIYKYAYTEEQSRKNEKMFNELFDIYIKALEEKDMSNDINSFYYNTMNENYRKNTKKEVVVVDFMSGMTDRYIIQQYRKYKNR